MWAVYTEPGAPKHLACATRQELIQSPTWHMVDAQERAWALQLMDPPREDADTPQYQRMQEQPPEATQHAPMDLVPQTLLAALSRLQHDLPTRQRWEVQQGVSAALVSEMEQVVKSARRADGYCKQAVAKALDI